MTILMSKEEVKVKINSINEYLGECSWMEFELCKMNGGQVVLSGSIDLSSGEYAIDIEFEQPYFVSSLFFWHADTSNTFIELADEKEIFELNSTYKIEQGCYIFKVSVEDFDNPPIMIVAKNINYKIRDENPFK